LWPAPRECASSRAAVRHPLSARLLQEQRQPLAKTPAATPTPEGLLPHQAFCLANGTFAYGSIEPCYPIRCNATILKSDMRIPHVMPYADTLVHEFYNYTHQFSVNCKKGYVSYKNSSVITGEIACDQSFRDPTQGEWSPPDLNTCTAVKCDDISTVISSQAAPYKAENRDDQKSYGEFQQSSFPFYPNLVSVKCRQIGYFFEDRQFEKLLRCGLANGSLIKAQWYGAQGTDLQRLKTLQCTHRIIRRTADAAAIVKNAQYKAKTTVKYGNGTVAIVPAIEVNLPETYPYATEISFTCENGTETGVGEPALFCKADGQWNTSDLPECIKKSEALQLQGNQKHYVPPAKEAGNAGSVGAVVIMIVVVFCVLVVILDLSTSAIECGSRCTERSGCFGFAFVRELCRLFAFDAFFGSWTVSEPDTAVFTRPLKMERLQLQNCSQSTLYKNASCSNAIDGNTDQNFKNGYCCMHTGCGSGRQEWWTASLPAASFVSDLIIYNRLDNNQAKRLNVFSIQLDGVTCVERNETFPFAIGNFSCSRFGSQLTVINDFDQCLSICEIQVFGFSYPPSSKEMSEEDAESMAALEALADMDELEMTDEKAAELQKKWRIRLRRIRWRKVYRYARAAYRIYRHLHGK
uniref:Sushi domain-containing protein n=1 Tax=Macrostomum lignano TaxID=282301 RepID=A0A1I8JEL3_9PLAT